MPAGEPPFRKEEDLAVVMAHLHEKAPPVTALRPDCPRPLADVVAKMLEKDPATGSRTCDELVDALSAATSIRWSGSPRPTWRTRTPWPSQDHRTRPGAGGPRRSRTRRASRGARPRRKLPAGASWALGALAGALVAVVVALLVSGGGDDDEAPEPAAPVAETAAPETELGAGPDVGHWRAVEESPTTRQQAASAVSGGRVWVIGGLKGTGTATATKKVQYYDPAIDTWSSGPELPSGSITRWRSSTTARSSSWAAGRRADPT